MIPGMWLHTYAREGTQLATGGVCCDVSNVSSGCTPVTDDPAISSSTIAVRRNKEW